MEGIVLFLILNFFHHSCFAQDQQLHPYFHQYTTEDGLPSSETYYLLQDQSDHLWIATDNGIARFDGYEFEVFGREEGLEDEVVFKILEGRDGRIWVSTYSGRVFYFEHGQFHPYHHNDLLASLKKRFHLLTLEDVHYYQGFLFKVRGKGLFYIDSSGGIHWITDQFENGIFVYSNGSEKPPLIFHKRDKTNEQRSIIIFDSIAQYWTPIDTLGGELAEISLGVEIARDNRLLLAGSGSLLIFDNDQFRQSIRKKLGHLPYAFATPQSGFFLCADDGGGLQFYQLSAKGTIRTQQTLLPGHSIAFGLYDRQGGLWVCSRDAGLFYAPYPNVDVYSKQQSLPGAKPLSIALAGDSVFFAGYSDGTIYYHNYLKGKTLPLFPEGTRQSHEAFSLYFDEKTSCLLANQFRFYLKNQFPNPLIQTEKYAFFPEHRLSTIREFDQPNATNERELLFNGLGFLGRYNLDEGTIHLNYDSKKQEHLTFHAYYEDREGRSWIGTLHGLCELHEEQGVVVDKNLSYQALRGRVEEIIQLPNEAFLFGTRGSGVIYYATDTIYTIDKHLGLADNNIRKLHLDTDGTVWVATLRGVSKLQFSASGTIKTLRSFGIPHGLASDEVYDIQSRGETVWLVSSKGIIRFREPAKLQFAPRPFIQALLINGDSSLVNSDTPIVLPFRENNLTIQFKTINYRMLRQIAYRYRHGPNANWQFTTQGEVNYVNLQPGHYSFEVQSRNQDGRWSESNLLAFEVRPPWYRQWAVQLALFAGLLGMIVLVFIQRDRRRAKEQAFMQQIGQLEKAALHAQMNPHFIFNSLTSIQNFILRNEKKSAVTYLSRFAYLIRSTLNVSIKGIHSLAEELKIIDHYLELESIRFAGGLNYEIQVAEHLQPDAIFLPPLLIQPFIENAIKHGLKDRITGGEVQVSFNGTTDQLEVRIRDNGIGFDPAKATSENSAGMNITRRRLELMREYQNSTPVLKIELKHDADGQITGTEIIIYIKTQQQSTTTVGSHQY